MVISGKLLINNTMNLSEHIEYKELISLMNIKNISIDLSKDGEDKENKIFLIKLYI
jgi:hypothetical protein